jgi:hypothetical protein
VNGSWKDGWAYGITSVKRSLLHGDLEAQQLHIALYCTVLYLGSMENTRLALEVTGDTVHYSLPYP